MQKKNWYNPGSWFAPSTNLEVKDAVPSGGGTYRDLMLAAYYGNNDAMWATNDYKSLIKYGYDGNVIARKCIDLRGGAIGSLDWDLFSTRKNAKEIDDHPILTLLAKPNPYQGQGLFFHTAQNHKDIAGNAYIRAIRATRSRPPVRLELLRPDFVKVIYDSNGLVQAYEYTVIGDDGKKQPTITVPADEVLHLKHPNPLSQFSGSSLMTSTWKSICIYNSALEHNKKTLDNGAALGGVLQADKALSREQTEKIQQQIADNYAGSQNSGKTMVLGGGMTWNPNTMNMRDLDFLKGKETTAREIATGFKVPPLLLNINGDNTFANFAEARLSFWEDTILPESDSLRDSLNAWLVPMFGDNVRLDYDRSTIPALEARSSIRWDRISQVTCLTINEQREALGYEPLPPEVGDVLPSGKPSQMPPGGTDHEPTGGDA